MQRNTLNAVLHGLFFVSGATSLILERLWLRGKSDGSTHTATTQA